MRALKVVDHTPSTPALPAADSRAAPVMADAELVQRLVGRIEQLHAELHALHRPTSPPPFIIVRCEHHYNIIDVNDIELIEADGNYVRVCTGQQRYRHRAAIGAVEKKLGGRRFARVHRSRIVNLSAVRCIAAWFSGDYVIELKSGARVKMSRTYWHELTQRFAIS